MPRRSKVELLPDDVRRQLDERLIAGAFGGYTELADWLETLGLEIGRSSLHRYGSRLEERVAQIKLATEQARAIVESSPDDEGAVSDALMRLLQERLMRLLIETDVDPNDKVRLERVARAVADLARATVTQRKWASEVRAAAQAAASAVERIARSGGMSDTAVSEIRAQILGIAS